MHLVYAHIIFSFCAQEMKLPLELVHARLINNTEIDRHSEFRKLCAGEKDFAQFVANRCAPLSLVKYLL